MYVSQCNGASCFDQRKPFQGAQCLPRFKWPAGHYYFCSMPTLFLLQRERHKVKLAVSYFPYFRKLVCTASWQRCVLSMSQCAVIVCLERSLLPFR